MIPISSPDIVKLKVASKKKAEFCVFVNGVKSEQV